MRQADLGQNREGRRPGRHVVSHAMVAVATLSAGLLMGQAASDRTLEVERIILRDEGGKVRMILSARAGEAPLRLFDSEETMRAGLGIVDGEPGFFLYDRGKQQRLSLSTLGGEPGLRLYDAAQVERAALTAKADTPWLALQSEDGRRLRLGTTQEVPGFEIRSPKQLVRRDPGGKGFGLMLSEADGRIRTFLDLTKAGPGLAMFDTEGKLKAVLDSTDQDPILALSDGRTIRAMLHVSGAGPSLSLYDAREKRIFSAP